MNVLTCQISHRPSSHCAFAHDRAQRPRSEEGVKDSVCTDLAEDHHTETVQRALLSAGCRLLKDFQLNFQHDDKFVYSFNYFLPLKWCLKRPALPTLLHIWCKHPQIKVKSLRLAPKNNCVMSSLMCWFTGPKQQMCRVRHQSLNKQCCPVKAGFIALHGELRCMKDRT